MILHPGSFHRTDRDGRRLSRCRPRASCVGTNRGRLPRSKLARVPNQLRPARLARPPTRELENGPGRAEDSLSRESPARPCSEAAAPAADRCCPEGVGCGVLRRTAAGSARPSASLRESGAGRRGAQGAAWGGRRGLPVAWSPGARNHNFAAAAIWP